jgi:hypothetical protein
MSGQLEVELLDRFDGREAFGLIEPFLLVREAFAMDNLLLRGLSAAPPKPHLGNEAGGAGSWALRAKAGRSTAPTPNERQSFLDNLVA